MNTQSKTLKQLATQFSMYQLDNIPAHVLNDSWFADRLDWYKERFEKKVNPLINIQGIESGVFLEVKQQKKNYSDEHDLYFVDQEYILVKLDNSDTILLLMCNRNKYHFYPLYSVVNLLTWKMTSIQINEATKVLKSPNEIGVFTLNKIKQWFEYCNQYVILLQDKKKEIEGKLNDNQTIIDNFIASIKTEKKISTYQNRTYIDTKYFNVIFELLDNGSYLSKKIEYKGSLNDTLTIINL
jgi:hypothetical protein